MRIDQIIQYHARQRSDNPALEQDERSLTYADVMLWARRIANGLASLNIGQGDRVVVLCENSIDEVLLFLGAASIGAVTVPINYRLAGPELAYIINDCQAKVVIVPDPQFVELIDSLSLQQGPTLLGSSSGLPDTWIDWLPWLQDQSADARDAQTQADDAFAQLYTSGTTGRPKGAIISHRNLIDLSMAGVVAAQERPSVGDNELVIAPLFHIGAVASLFHSLMLGVSVVLHSSFNPHAVVDAIERHQLKILFMVPAMIQAILAAVPNLEQRDFSSLKRINYGAAPIGEGLLSKALAVFDCDFQQSYGMTETSGAVSQLTVADHHKALAGRPELLASCGRQNAASQMRVVDADGNPVADGELGEIVVKSTTNMLGYWNLPEQTAQTLRNGWLHTGDVGYRDAEGYFFLKDRMKDMVVSGGENIYPNEVERILLQHGDIADVAVIGIPDEKFGEALLACCVMAAEASLDSDALIAFCRDQLAGYKVPRQYVALAELPRNLSGKVLKTVLREPYWQGQTRNIG